MKKKSENFNKHMDYSERNSIENMLNCDGNITFAKIGDAINKDPTTIKKEIEKRRLPKTNAYDYGSECSLFAACKRRKQVGCLSGCDNFIQFYCKKRDKTPLCCNGCPNFKSCHYQKYYYRASEAENSYKSILSESRQGFNISKEEADEIGSKIAEPIKNGNSVYAVLQTFPEIKYSERTIYTYIEGNLFKKDFNITVMNLRRVVSRKLPKSKRVLYKKRKDRTFLIGRLYVDYVHYMEYHPNAYVTQMDTVYNDVSNGPFIQTFKIVKLGILVAIYHTSKTSDAMLGGVKILRNILGDELYKKYVEVILTDRGSEFVKADEVENMIPGWKGHIFYCDPMCSNQKGSLENNHIELRYICPKEKDLYALGLTGQQPLNVATSNINSFAKEKLNGKSPLDIVQFFDEKLYSKLTSFGIKHIEKKDVILKPSILAPFKK